MKKIGKIAIKSLIVFWSYFLTSTIGMMLLQTIMRVFVDSDSRGEYFWKTIYLYACIFFTCLVYLKYTAPSHKPQFLLYMREKQGNFKDFVIYTLKSSDFWGDSIGFSIWPVLVPQFFGVVNLLYVNPDFLEKFPQSILCIFTVSFPIILLSFVCRVLMLHNWYKNRLHDN